MPKKLKIYDKQTGEAIERFAVTANEAVRNDPGRYAFTPWKSTKVSERDKVKADEAAAAAKAAGAPLDAEGDTEK
jgi:hypothetical protein